MQLGEVVLQGVAGFPELTRVPVGAGVTLVLHVDGRPSSLPDVVGELMFPMGHSTLSQKLPPGAQARIGMLAKGRDGVVYRVLRDLGTGRSSLIKVEGESGVPITDDDLTIEEHSRDHLGVGNREIFDSLFLLRDTELPSRTGDDEGLNLDEGGPSFSDKELVGFDQAAAGTPNLSEDERTAKIEKLERMLAISEEIGEVQFGLDGLNRKLFAAEETLAAVEQQASIVRECEEQLIPLERVATVPDGLPGKVESIHKERDNLKRKIAISGEDITDLRQKMERELGKVKSAREMVVGSFSDPLVRYGVLAGVAALVAGVVGAFVAPRMQMLALLDIPAFGVAVFGAFRYMGQAQAVLDLKLKIRRLQGARDEQSQKVDSAAVAVQELLGPHGLSVDDLEGLDGQKARYNEIKAELDAAQAHMDELKESSEIQEAISVRESLAKECKDTEARLYEMGAGVPDGGQIRFELDELRAAGGAKPSASVDQFGMGIAAAPAAQGGLGSAFQAASEQLDSTPRQLFDAVKARVAQYVSGLSDRRYGEVRLEPGLLIYESTTAQLLPFHTLPPGDKDLIYLALKLTLIEHAVSENPVPVFLDGAFSTFPQGKTPLIVRMLQFLGSKTQVVCITRNEGLQSAATSRVQL